MSEFLHHFTHLLGEAFPLFLLGLLLGSALEVWLPRAWTDRWIAGGKFSVGIACLTGALLPGCAMSTVPLARTLRSQGVPVGTIAAFLMIAPLLSPHTVVMTATLISWQMAVMRVVLSFALAYALGVILNRLSSEAPPAEGGASSPRPEAESESCGGEGECCCREKPSEPAAEPGFRRWLRRIWASFRELSPLLLIGLAAAALLLAVFPLENFRNELKSGWMAYGAAVLLGIPAYVCDGGEIPLTRSLLAVGVGPGPAFAFMMGSVGTCLGTMAMSVRIIGWRPTAAYVATMLLLAVGGGLLVQLWMG